jgi:AcrR family transcriptional regulator
LEVFYRKGFDATSLRDIEEATGLHPGSLYSAFGSKDGLFTAVLDRYRNEVVEARVSKFLTGARDPRDGVCALFRSTFEGKPTPDPGCLVTNSAIESPALSPGARTEVSASLDALRAGFRAAVSRISGDAGQVERAADQLLALYQGLLVLVRYGSHADTLHAVTEAAGELLDNLQRGR